MKKLIVLANTILIPNAVSGGDLVLPEMIKYLNNIEIHVIGNHLAQKLWLGYSHKIVFHAYYPSFIERFEPLVWGPLKYSVRTIQCLHILFSLAAKENHQLVIYSSSDFFPDVIPAILARFKFHHVRWIGRIYHIIEPPWRRKANFLPSIFSFLAQQLGLLLLKMKANRILVLRGAYTDAVRYGFKKDQIHPVDIGIDLQKMKMVQPVDKKFDAVTVGSLSISRGMKHVIPIWQKVTTKLPYAKLAVIGGGTLHDIDHFQMEIKEAGLQENIQYFGFLPEKKDVYAIMKACKLYLCPKNESGWNIGSIEAYALGIPTVSFAIEMFSSAITQGHIAVAVNDYAAFSEAIVGLLLNKKKRMKLGREAFAFASQLDIQIIAKQLKKELEHV